MSIRLAIGGLLAALTRPMKAGRGCIVCLHRILPEERLAILPENRSLELTPEALREILTWVKAQGFQIATLDEIPARLRQQRGRKFIAFTLDDGYRDNLEFALPVFREFNVPFAVNITTGFVDRTEPVWWYVLEHVLLQIDKLEIVVGGKKRLYPLQSVKERNAALDEMAKSLRALDHVHRNEALTGFCDAANLDAWMIARNLMLTWGEVRELASDPLVTIGAHTRGHYSLAALDEESVRKEMLESRHVLESQLNRSVDHFAYPFGGANAAGEREFRIAQECGFVTALTTRNANLYRPDAEFCHSLPRISISGNLTAPAKRLAIAESGLFGQPRPRSR